MPVTAPRVTGRWRIVETELWDVAYLTPGPSGARLPADDRHGCGEMGYGAFAATLDCGFTPGGVDFTLQGMNEGDEVNGTGWADLQIDGSLPGEISYHFGDETTFKAVPCASSSTPC